jgi:hypothetical protein
MKNEYLSNEYSISALDRIANAKDRPLTLIGQFPKEEMEEVHLMLRHGILGGQIIQAPPNQVHYLLRVDRINEAGTRLLIEAFPEMKAQIAEFPDEQLESEAAGRPGDPKCELAKQELARRADAKQPKPAAIAEKAMTPSQTPPSAEAIRIAQSSHRLSRKANGIAQLALWTSLASAVISLAALWIAWSASQSAREQSRDASLEQRVRALEQRSNASAAPFMVLPSQTPAPATSTAPFNLPNGGSIPNIVPATPWLIPPRP